MTPQSPIISTLQKSYEPTLLTVLCHLQFFLENRNVQTVLYLRQGFKRITAIRWE